MRVQGEFIFNSFEEALGFVSNPTNYEKDHNITIIDQDIVLSQEDLKVVMMKKSDNTNTAFIFFRNSTKYDIWKFWCPSERQIEFLAIIGNLIKIEDKKNGMARV